MTAPVRPPGEATREARGHQRSGRPAQPPELQGAGPERRPPARAVTAALAATVLVALAGLVLTGLEWGSQATSDAVGSVGAVAGAIAYAALGALIVRRAGNLVGWFMLAEGAATAVMITGSAYAIFGAKAHPGTLSAAAAVGTLAEAVFVLVAIDLAAENAAARRAGQHTRVRHPRRGHRTRHASPPRTGRGQVSWPPNATKTC